MWYVIGTVWVIGVLPSLAFFKFILGSGFMQCEECFECRHGSTPKGHLSVEAKFLTVLWPITVPITSLYQAFAAYIQCCQFIIKSVPHKSELWVAHQEKRRLAAEDPLEKEFRDAAILRSGCETAVAVRRASAEVFDVV